jgi:hypothetical protein
MQTLLLGHEIELRAVVPSILTGEDHDVPS